MSGAGAGALAACCHFLLYSPPATRYSLLPPPMQKAIHGITVAHFFETYRD
jgi:hypothetical protein